jgi:DNA-binding transcriptional ArsR family regulator
MPEKIEDPEQALLFLLRHPLRRELLRLYVKEDGSLSPKQLSDFTKAHLSLVGHHVRELAKHGAVELVGTQPRRGSVEHFYEATSLVDAVPWARAALGLQHEPKGSSTKARESTDDEGASDGS